MTGEFFKGLTIDARRDLEFLARRVQCLPSHVLIAEEQEPFDILFILEGEVNISMNSGNGRQFLLRVAVAGDIVGLASAISGVPSEIKAVARRPCKIWSLSRQDFLDLLIRHPCASQCITRELSLLCRRACERLRILGLTTSARAKLASLLLDWCRDGHQTDSGTQIRFVMTREEIGDCIGASRETVTRTLIEFKNHKLVTMRGSTMIIPSRDALAIYAGIDATTDSRLQNSELPGPSTLPVCI